MTKKEKETAQQLIEDIENLITGLEIYKSEIREAKFKLCVITNKLDKISILDCPFSCSTKIVLKKLGYSNLKELKDIGVKNISKKIYELDDDFYLKNLAKVETELEDIFKKITELK